MAVKTDPTESLRRVPLFAGLDRKELELLARLAKEQRYEAGATIVKSGASGHGLYIIKEGKVSVVRDGQKVAAMGPVRFLGRSRVSAGDPRPPKARATTRPSGLTRIPGKVQ